ncbi:MAG TPA: DUF4349 domain-containing protein [Actinomycetota bacterium]|nr:DUF4349 domain-containing protein [Actinomycetota bacterium]
MKRAAIVVVILLVVAGVVGYFVRSGGFATFATSADSAGPAFVGAAEARGAGGAVVEGVPAEPGVAMPEEGVAIGEIGALPAIGPDIIKTADIAVVVDEGKFQSAFNAVSVIAGKYGGFVQSSSTTGRESRTGSLLIRVPAQSFDEALSDLATQLGDVTRRSESGQDVSATFIDLEARLRTWEAQEAVLLRLMNEAKSIEETLRVQQQLQDVQFRIEEIKGQLQMLRDQVELATISLFLRERGAPVVTGPVADRPDLAEAWDLALNGVLGVVFAVVVGLGYVLPLTVAGVVGWFVYRRLRPRHLPAVS